MTDTKRPLFPLGQTLATPGAVEALEEAKQSASELLDRHARGDWGVVCAEDKALNDEALRDGSRLLSAYMLRTGVKLWIITEAADDEGFRTATTLLLPDEY
ncbi:MAG TPA: hypothetical protein VF170_13445 [Planctomycetaceae bacterium]